MCVLLGAAVGGPSSLSESSDAAASALGGRIVISARAAGKLPGAAARPREPREVPGDPPDDSECAPGAVSMAAGLDANIGSVYGTSTPSAVISMGSGPRGPITMTGVPPCACAPAAAAIGDENIMAFMTGADETGEASAGAVAGGALVAPAVTVAAEVDEALGAGRDGNGDEPLGAASGVAGGDASAGITAPAAGAGNVALSAAGCGDSGASDGASAFFKPPLLKPCIAPSSPPIPPLGGEEVASELAGAAGLAGPGIGGRGGPLAAATDGPPLCGPGIGGMGPLGGAGAACPLDVAADASEVAGAAGLGGPGIGGRGGPPAAATGGPTLGGPGLGGMGPLGDAFAASPLDAAAGAPGRGGCRADTMDAASVVAALDSLLTDGDEDGAAAAGIGGRGGPGLGGALPATIGGRGAAGILGRARAAAAAAAAGASEEAVASPLLSAPVAGSDS